MYKLIFLFLKIKNVKYEMFKPMTKYMMKFSLNFEIFQELCYDAGSLDMVLYEVNTCIRSEKYYTRYIEAYTIYRISRG